ncbi:MAG TPA: ABC transporter ATP-binding protein, partial [Gammaproteobacteria bacterium]|nr:ABC transporter ATP-binding protein [Gammaproteobacteria bacterium]
MLKINNLALRRGTRLLLERVNLDVFPGQRLGLTGANGSGKSSLFSVIAGRLEADQGSVTLPRGTLISEVMQETPQSEDSAIEYVIDGDQQFRAVERHIRRAEQANDGARLAEWHDNLEQIDGFTVSARAGQLLHGLGFTAKEQRQSVNTFSGGWRMRLNLAQSLMTRADLLLLDEPTNHLDLDAMVWLERWLSAYDGMVLVISHDREFLDRSVSRIAHIEGLTLTVYEGNYSQAESRRAAALDAQRKQHASQQRKIAHMRSFVDRFRYKATKARQAQSRLKALERLETVLPVHERTAFVFEFEPAEQMPHQLMDLERVDAGYDHAILSNVNFRLAEGARIGLLGRNGAGKTTLMKVLASRLEPLAGSYTSAAGIRIGYFAQHQLELLDPERSPLEHLTELAGQGSDRRLRAFLGRFGFGGDAAGEAVGLRSGGEKARLVLALIVYTRPNLLLLDEPTNHLDIDMRQSICMALQTYRGCLVVVAH